MKHRFNIFSISHTVRARAVAAFVCVAIVSASVFSFTYMKPFVRVAEAAFNGQINYQGKLTNTSNAAVADGVYHMQFRLYTAATGGSLLWTEDRSTALGDRVTVTNGLFSVMLGSSTPLTSVNFNQTLYLEVDVGGSPPHLFEGGRVDRKAVVLTGNLNLPGETVQHRLVQSPVTELQLVRLAAARQPQLQPEATSLLGKPLFAPVWSNRKEVSEADFSCLVHLTP